MNTVIVIWGLIDRNVINDVERINEKFKRWCIGKGLTFIDSNNIKEFCLNRRVLSHLENNLKKYLGSL